MQRLIWIHKVARRKLPDVLAFEASIYATVSSYLLWYDACKNDRIDILRAIGIPCEIAHYNILRAMRDSGPGALKWLLNFDMIRPGEPPCRKLMSSFVTRQQRNHVRILAEFDPTLLRAVLSTMAADSDIAGLDILATMIDKNTIMRIRNDPIVDSFTPPMKYVYGHIFRPSARPEAARWYMVNILPLAPDTADIFIICLCGYRDSDCSTLVADAGALYPLMKPISSEICSILLATLDRISCDLVEHGSINIKSVQALLARYLPHYRFPDSSDRAELRRACSKRLNNALFAKLLTMIG